MSANVHGVAVLEGIALILRVRHHDGVQCSDAAALAIADINIKLDGASEKVWLKVGVRVQSGLRREIHAIVVVEADLGAAPDFSLGPIPWVLDVQLCVGSIN